jgi:hypothetical protein
MTDDGDGAKVHSITERAEAGEHEEPEQEEFPLGLFEIKGGRTLKNLIRAGEDVQMMVSMRAAEVPLRGTMPDPDTDHRVIATCHFEQVQTVAIRDKEGHRTGWKARVILRPHYVEAASASLGETAEG